MTLLLDNQSAMSTRDTSPHVNGASKTDVNEKRPPVIRSEGQRLFLLAERSPIAAARALGQRSHGSVTDWRSGRSVPSAEGRERIAAVYGIPPVTWSLRPGTKVNAEPTVETVAAVAGPAPSSLDDCMALLAVLRKDRAQQGLSPADRVRLSDAEARILALRARLEAARELSEGRYVFEHPAWLRIKRMMVRALEPYPKALTAVLQGLSELTDGNDLDRE
jgi:transcriptional regulator with XRE-family HTH domain